MNKVCVNTECDSCGGTGVYHGFCEAEGEAVVCLRCDGTGCAKIYYMPFTKRKNRRGINTIRLSRGGFLATDVGGFGDSITYTEFKKGKMPCATKK